MLDEGSHWGGDLWKREDTFKINKTLLRGRGETKTERKITAASGGRRMGKASRRSQDSNPMNEQEKQTTRNKGNEFATIKGGGKEYTRLKVKGDRR